MLIYQLRERRLDFGADTEMVFPSEVVVQVRFGPPEAFGEGDGPSGIVLKGHDAKGEGNLFTGRLHWRCSPRLQPLSVSIADGQVKFEFKGTLLTLRSVCDTSDQFGQLIASCMYVLPMLINVGLFDPPVVSALLGTVGGKPFTYTLSRSAGLFKLTSQEFQEKHLLKSWTRLPMVVMPENRRLLAALNYFHVACRLLAVGHSAFEFMAEVILNYAKVLDVLFATTGEVSRDLIRQSLRTLGYSDSEIERDFIPLLLLRNEFDVAHVALTVPNVTELNTLHRYTDKAEGTIRDLLERVLAGVETGSYRLLPGPDREELDPAKAKILATLRSALALDSEK